MVSLYPVLFLCLTNNLIFESVSSVFVNFYIFKFIFYLNNHKLNLVLVLVFLISLNKSNNSKTNLILICILLCCFLNKPIYTTFLFFKKYLIINTTLTNGLSLIHPTLVLITYVLLLENVLNKSTFKLTIVFKNRIFFLFGIIISFFALILGSFWAQQELNWGGWWNWDVVELILLIFFFRFLVFYHLNFCLLLVKKKKNWIFYIILFFIFVRVDIMASIHSFSSFNSLENFYIYINLSLLLIVFYYFVSNIDYYIKYKKIFKEYLTLNINYSMLFITLYIHIIIVFIIQSLVINIIYNFDNIDLFFDLINYQQFLLVNSFYFFLKKIDSIIKLVFLINVGFLEAIFILSYFFILRKSKNYVHIYFFILIVIYLMFSSFLAFNEYNKAIYKSVNFLITDKFSNFHVNFFKGRDIIFYNNKIDFSLFSLTNFVFFFDVFISKNKLNFFNNISTVDEIITLLRIDFIFILSLIIIAICFNILNKNNKTILF